MHFTGPLGRLPLGTQLSSTGETVSGLGPRGFATAPGLVVLRDAEGAGQRQVPSCEQALGRTPVDGSSAALERSGVEASGACLARSAPCLVVFTGHCCVSFPTSAREVGTR